MSPGALPGASAVLQRYLGEPRARSAVQPLRPAGNAGDGRYRPRLFACTGAPLRDRLAELGLRPNDWHTNRDTYDKIVSMTAAKRDPDRRTAYRAAEDSAAMRASG